MRSFIIALIIAGLIVGGTIFSTYRIEVVSKKILDDNQKVVDAVNANDFKKAKTLV